MLVKFGVKLAQWLLNRGDLSMEDSARLTATVLDKTGALPFESIVDVNADGLRIGGKEVSFEQAKDLRESAIAAINNKALNLVMEQVTFLVVTQSVHKSETIAQLQFGRAGIWLGQNIKKSLLDLAQKSELDA